MTLSRLVLLAITVLACNKPLPNVTPKKSPPPPSPPPPSPPADAQQSDVVSSAVVVDSPILAENVRTEAAIVAKFGVGTQVIVPSIRNHLWIATANGLAKHLLLQKGAIVGQKSWSGLAGGGTRTYVLEGGGAMLTNNGGKIFFLHDGVSEGNITANLSAVFYQLKGPVSDDRTCVVSYRRNGKRFIGMAWGYGKFSEVEQADTPPYGPKYELLKEPVTAGAHRWGYSCYIDQERLLFYSQFNEGATQGLDLKTMTPINLAQSTAPDANFVSTTIADMTIGMRNLGKGGGSYAMSGDRWATSSTAKTTTQWPLRVKQAQSGPRLPPTSPSCPMNVCTRQPSARAMPPTILWRPLAQAWDP